MSNYDPKYRKRKKRGAKPNVEIDEEQARASAFWYFDRWRYYRWAQGYQKVRMQ